jgi:hypothetical protein
VANVVQSHKDLFSDVTYVDTFNSLVLRYEQNTEVPASNGKGSER